MTATALAEAPIAPALPELSFPDGLVGFPAAKRFALARWGDDPSTMFSVLRSLDIEDLEFVVVPPQIFFRDYAPELDDSTVARLGLVDPDDALVLSIVTVGETPEACTANLLGPVVVNLKNLSAAQAVQRDERWTAREPLGS